MTLNGCLTASIGLLMEEEFPETFSRKINVHKYPYIIWNDNFTLYLDLEAMMNSFISLILFCTYDDKLTRKFIVKMTEIGASENNALLRIKMWVHNDSMIHTGNYFNFVWANYLPPLKSHSFIIIC